MKAAKLNFIKLQLANDLGTTGEIREFTTPALYAELERDLAARAGQSQQTEVAALDARVLQVVTEHGMHWVSVRFSGMLRESAGETPHPFSEVWNLQKPVDGSSGWLLAGIQQLA